MFKILAQNLLSEEYENGMLRSLNITYNLLTVNDELCYMKIAMDCKLSAVFCKWSFINKETIIVNVVFFFFSQRLNFPALKKPALMKHILHALKRQVMTPLTSSQIPKKTVTVKIRLSRHQNHHPVKPHNLTF